VAGLSELGFDVTQATVSRDIAELGLAKVMRGPSVYVTRGPRPAARPASTSACGGSSPTSRRDRPQRPDPRPHRPAGHGRTIAQAIDESTLTDQVARSRATIRSSSCSPTASLERWLDRFEAPQPPAGGIGGHLDEQGRPRLLRRPRHVRCRRVAARAVRRRRRHADRRRGGGSLREGVERRAMSAGAARRTSWTRADLLSQYVGAPSRRTRCTRASTRSRRRSPGRSSPSSS
jgi:hypothetical protein